VLNYALNTGAGVLSAIALFADVAFFSFGMGPIPCVTDAGDCTTDSAALYSSATSCRHMRQAQRAVSAWPSSASPRQQLELMRVQLAAYDRRRRPVRADAPSARRRQRLLRIRDSDRCADRRDPRAVQRLSVERRSHYVIWRWDSAAASL